MTKWINLFDLFYKIIMKKSKIQYLSFFTLLNSEFC